MGFNSSFLRASLVALSLYAANSSAGLISDLTGQHSFAVVVPGSAGYANASQACKFLLCLSALFRLTDDCSASS